MLERLFEKDVGIAHQSVQMGILFPTLPPTRRRRSRSNSSRSRTPPSRPSAWTSALLPNSWPTRKPTSMSVHDLVLANDSTARRVAQAPFEKVPFCLSPSSATAACTMNSYA